MKTILSLAVGFVLWSYTTPDTPGSDPWAGQWVDLTYAFDEHDLLADCGQVPFRYRGRRDDFKVIALPMKIKDGSGGPLRIIALVQNG